MAAQNFLYDQNLNDQILNDQSCIARLHALVLFILDTVITIFCLLFLMWFFVGTITIYPTQETECTCNIARDCKELYEQGHTCSGVYTIKPDEFPAFEVYCDMSNGGGWTVFQRRMDGSVNFFRERTEYIKGFGDLNGEFWLGLNKIHRLTATGNTSLRVDLKDFEGVSVFAHYSTFIVGDALTKYTLTVGGYSGNAGDSLSSHNNMKFSTHDDDNDLALNGNCASAYKGAWWYFHGHHSNLNGQYLTGEHSTDADGVNWNHFKGYSYSLKVSEMKITRN